MFDGRAKIVEPNKFDKIGQPVPQIATTGCKIKWQDLNPFVTRSPKSHLVTCIRRIGLFIGSKVP